MFCSTKETTESRNVCHFSLRTEAAVVFQKDHGSRPDSKKYVP
ncbi:Low-density lipoprotein receptor-related protein, partial [Araneus ventricosus]